MPFQMPLDVPYYYPVLMQEARWVPSSEGQVGQVIPVDNQMNFMSVLTSCTVEKGTTSSHRADQGGLHDGALFTLTHEQVSLCGVFMGSA